MRDKQKLEALKRMKLLNLHPTVIDEFMQQDKLNLSEFGGFLYWLDESQQRVVEDFERKYNALVYHVIHSFTEFGELLTFLYVSDYPEEWDMDTHSLQAGIPIAYVKNLSNDCCSEFGSVGIRPNNGGLIRTE